MSALLARLTSAPIRWQIAALLVITQIAAHAVTIVVFRDAMAWSGNLSGALAAESVGPFSTTLRIANAVGGDGGVEVLYAAAESDPRFSISPVLPAAAGDARTAFDRRFQDALRPSIPAPWRDRLTAYEIPGLSILLVPSRSLEAAVQMADGNWFIYQQGEKSIWGLIPSAVVLLGVLILTLPLALLAIWSSWVLVSPISSLATGVDRFSRDLDAPAISVRGAREVRVAAAAFNAMRVRIRRLVEDRSRTLAAISHDMRTPLTRLKLRAESIDDPVVREPVVGDIDIIERMIDSALSFLRSQRDPLSLVKVDVAALTQTVVSHLTDQEIVARYEGPERAVITCDPDLIRRAIENVTNNAIAHAGSVVARLHAPSGEWVVIDILDEGPGIPDRCLEGLMEPFKKADGARPVAEGDARAGFGLGLAITRMIVEAHGGTLTLRRNRPHGLIVEIRLPLRAEQRMVSVLAHREAAGFGFAS